ncbi:hypothetical protein RZS08_36595, partial [Arthrospira platensis SPKY1]|nr:hypothetical protein [Arthrospira platensis SPKY1]
MGWCRVSSVKVQPDVRLLAVKRKTAGRSCSTDTNASDGSNYCQAFISILFEMYISECIHNEPVITVTLDYDITRVCTLLVNF